MGQKQSSATSKVDYRLSERDCGRCLLDTNVFSAKPKILCVNYSARKRWELCATVTYNDSPYFRTWRRSSSNYTRQSKKTMISKVNFVVWRILFVRYVLYQTSAQQTPTWNRKHAFWKPEFWRTLKLLSSSDRNDRSWHATTRTCSANLLKLLR